MDIKVLLQAFTRVWFIEESEAIRYALVLHQMINGNGAVSAGLFDDAPPAYITSTGVQVIPVAGPLFKNDFCGQPGTTSMGNMVKAANNDSSIQSIVLSIDSPGGTVDGTEAFANIIKQSKKPVVAHATTMASAAYWIGSSANEVIIEGNTSMVGSIGTMASIKDMRAFQEKNGIKELMITATRSTHKNKAYTDAMDGNTDTYIKDVLDPLNEVFLGAVQSNRQGKINLGKEDVLTGKMYIGQQAIKVGLADKIGGLDYAIKRSLQLSKTIQ